MKNNNKQVREKSKWYFVDNRLARLSVKISGLNLQGSGKTSGFFFTKELKTTVFMLQMSIFSFTWQCSRTFDEFKEFYLLLRRDETLGPNRNSLNSPFPSGNEGDCDVMVLLERREMMEEFLQEVVAKIDFELYEPLNLFVNARENMKRLLLKVAIVKKAFRKHVARKKLNLRLFKFYSKELLKFVYTMESGLEVFDANCNGLTTGSVYADRDSFTGVSAAAVANSSQPAGMPLEYVMWLDVCEEMALSRLCVATKEVFELPAADYEDERLANGIFLSDIAEVRRGAASHGFKTSKAAWIKPAMCVSIVGSERTIDVQFTSEEDMSRLFFVDMLSLLAVQALHASELQLRNRRYRRVNVNQHLKVFRPKMTARDISNAQKMSSLLETGIEVDVETYSPYYGIGIRQKLLKYNAAERKLYITNKTLSDLASGGHEGDAETSTNNTSHDDHGDNEDDEEAHAYDNDGRDSSSSADTDYAASETDHSPSKTDGLPAMSGDLTTQNRCIDIDDISEVRPGKISFCADGSEDSLVLTLVASETIVCLPVSTIKLRNNLINRFQAFFALHRDTEALDCDLPRVFRRKSTTSVRRNGSASASPVVPSLSAKSDAAPTTRNSLTSKLSGLITRPSFITTASNSVAAAEASAKAHKKPSAGHKKHSPRLSDGRSHHHLNRKEQIYSHLLQVRSVSMVRSSTMSSRNSASISEFLSRSSEER